jgi:hypothetical protein
MRSAALLIAFTGALANAAILAKSDSSATINPGDAHFLEAAAPTITPVADFLENGGGSVAEDDSSSCSTTGLLACFTPGSGAIIAHGTSVTTLTAPLSATPTDAPTTTSTTTSDSGTASGDVYVGISITTTYGQSAATGTPGAKSGAAAAGVEIGQMQSVFAVVFGVMAAFAAF